MDRFEGDMAVIEYNGKTFDLPRELLPVGAKGGDVVRFHIEIDRAATEERRKKI
ncbi:MAG: DUF3006 domain-containing protein [Peptococcaceae bacterium]|nr:DUF3006 domain-containing protein [Peptococcaceae bacterium]